MTSPSPEPPHDLESCHALIVRLQEELQAATLDPPQPDKEDEQPNKQKKKKKRTSRGRRPRVFPEFLPREEHKHFLRPEEIPAELRDHPDARRFFKKIGETLEIVPIDVGAGPAVGRVGDG